MENIISNDDFDKKESNELLSDVTLCAIEQLSDEESIILGIISGLIIAPLKILIASHFAKKILNINKA